MKNPLFLAAGLLVSGFAYAQTGEAPQAATIGQFTTAPVFGTNSVVWEAASVLPLERVIEANRPDGLVDISGSFQAGWTDTGLYIRVDATDDILVDNTAHLQGSDFWNGDMLEIFIDYDGSAGSAYDGTTDYQIVIPRDGKAPFINNTSASATPLLISQISINVEQKGTGDGQIIEVMLPWSPVIEAPAVGHELGLDVYLKDSDEATVRESQIAWSSTYDNAWREPDIFGRVTLATAGGGAQVLIADGFPDTDRFNGSLPEEARWVQTAAEAEGVSAQIAANSLIDGNALEVANTGWVQWIMAAFPRRELVNIGDQLILTFDVVFPTGGIREGSDSFLVGFLDQAGNPVATTESTGDFGNYGTGKANGWSSYFVSLATGGGGNSTLSKRGTNESFQGWWFQATNLGAFSGPAIAEEDIVYTVSLGVVKSGENEVMLFMVDPETGGVTEYAKDVEPVASAFDAIAFRALFNADTQTPPVYQLDNLSLTFIDSGDVPGSGGTLDPVVLINDDFTDTNRFDGELPEQSRWILNNTSTYGANAFIQPVSELSSSALYVENGGLNYDAQAIYSAFPRTTLVEVGDQLELDFELAFNSDDLLDVDAGFLIGFIDQNSQDVATLGSTEDFANIGGYKVKQFASYAIAFATGAGTLSQVQARPGLAADALNDSRWWPASEQMAFTTNPLLEDDAFPLRYRIILRLVLIDENTVGLFYYNREDATAFTLGGVTENPPTFSLDALSFRYEVQTTEEGASIIAGYAIDNLKLTFIPQGEIPDIGGGSGGTGDRGTPPVPVEVTYANTPFGEVMDHTAPYVYSENQGWMYTGAGAVEAANWFYIYDYGIGWVYTTQEIWPFMYNVNRSEWTYYFGFTGGKRWFFSYGQDQAYSIPMSGGRTRYVANWGTNGASGSFDDPILTIQEAVDTAEPGDVITIRGGVYEESVELTVDGRIDAPITLTAYGSNGIPEKVTLSALESVTPGENGFGEWEVHDGQIYKIQVPSTFTKYGYGAKSLVFANGKIITPARHPNTIDYWVVTREDMMRAVTATKIDGGLTSYTHPLLEGYPTNAWRGAYMRVYPRTGWYYNDRIVDRSEDGSIAYSNSTNEFFDPAIPEDPFLLFNALPALDQPDEAFFDFLGRWGARNVLYVWMPDGSDPSQSEIKFKTRSIGIESSNASHYSISHIEVLAGQMLFSENAHYIQLDHVDVRYGANNEEPWSEDCSVEFAGDHCSFTNGSVLYSDFGNIANWGAHNIVENNVFGFAGWVNVHGDVDRGLYYFNLSYNTVFQSEGVNSNINGAASHYTMNHVYTGGTVGNDIANMNAHGGGDYLGTVVAYNWVHGAYGLYDPTRPGANGGFGIRPDAGDPLGAANFRIFRNVVWDVSRHDISSWAQLTPEAPRYGDTQNYIYHNTVEDEITIAPGNRGNAEGTYVRNNIMLGSYNPIYNPNDPDTVVEFNVIGTGDWGEFNLIGDAMVMDFANHDFTLQPGSPAIDFGGFLGQGIEQDYTGDYPDAGAYEYGVEPWYPGARIRWLDLYDLTLVDNGDGTLSVNGFPIGRKPTMDFMVRLGETGQTAQVQHFYNTDTNLSEVTVELDVSGLNSPVPVFFSLDGVSFIRATQLF